MGRGITIFSLTLLLLTGTATTDAQGTNRYEVHRTGHFEGTALNTTANQRGKVVLDLYALDPASGAVRAYFGASDGLEGEAWLSGTIGSDGELRLSGMLSSFRMEVDGRLSPNGTVEASYRLTGATSQEGRFEVSFQHELPDAVATAGGRGSAPGLADLIGAWEVGGALPAQTNPITGQTTGVSFVDARKLEIFPDGGFQHLWTHEHCGGIGIARCCSQQAILERGTVSVEGTRLVLDVTGGDTLVKDACNPALNHQGPADRRQVSVTWSLGSGPGGPTLCLKPSSGDAVCYQKQS